MSVQIYPVLPEGTSWGEREEPCLCAQASDAWVNVLDAINAGRDVATDDHADVMLAADTACPSCRGTGFEIVPVRGPEVSWSNDTTVRIFALLGWRADGPDGLVGYLTLPVAQRDLAFARRRLESGVRVVEREAQVGPLRAIDDDHEMACVGPRFRSAGLGHAGMAERLDALERVLDDAATFGCTEVAWS